MVQVVQPLLSVEEPLVLSGDTIIHILHGETNVMGKVLKCFLYVQDPSPGVGPRVKAHIASLMCSSQRSTIKPPSLPSTGVSPPLARFLLWEGWTTSYFPLSYLGVRGREKDEKASRMGSLAPRSLWKSSLLRELEEQFGLFLFQGSRGCTPLDDPKPPQTDLSMPEKRPI